MTDSVPTTVLFVCRTCGAGYQATQRRFPGENAGSFHCHVCRSEVHAWHGEFHFSDWKPFEAGA
jgi:hypothetical protein